MKRIFRKAAAISFVVLASPCFSNTYVIYGFEAASHFNSEAKREFYIQAGSFLHKTKAECLHTLLQSKTHYPVSITHKARLYHVLVGPMNSSATVKQAANEVLAVSSKPQPVLDTSKVTEKGILGYDGPQSSAAVSKGMDSHWYVGIGAGNQFSQFSRSMTVNNNSGAPSPFDQDIYSVKGNNTQAVFTLSAGRRWERDSLWLPAYSAGLFYQHSAATNPGDTVTQYSDPEFTNYTYNWNISSNLILALLKVDVMKWGRVSPYILGGIGGAFNRTSAYGETALPGLTATRVSPGFQGNTTGQFAYMAGAGIDFQLAKQFILSAEYQYQNLGQVMSGPGAGSWSSQSLHLGTYHANTLLLNLVYLIGK